MLKKASFSEKFNKFNQKNQKKKSLPLLKFFPIWYNQYRLFVLFFRGGFY